MHWTAAILVRQQTIIFLQLAHCVGLTQYYLVTLCVTENLFSSSFTALATRARSPDAVSMHVRTSNIDPY